MRTLLPQGCGIPRKTVMVCYILISLLFLAGIPVLAQTTTGNIAGTVTDSSGAVVPNARVTAKNVANGLTFSTTTNSQGNYNLHFLPIGHYMVKVAAKGFAGRNIGPFSLEIDQNADVNAVLTVASAKTTVQVKSNFVPLLNTTNHTISTTFTSNAIQNMPLNGRNFSSLTIFLPGAVTTQPNGFSGNNGTERDTNQAGQVSVNGNRNQTNDYYLDGIEINETINNLIGYNPAPEALAQVKVVSADAPAEYGNVNGGAVLAVTKSGSNHFHGSVYYFLENYLLDANTWGNKHHPAGSIIPRTHFTEQTFGATFGGPVVKNKLYFFVDYEGFRYPQSGSGSASVPTAAMRSGDFSQLGYQLYDNSNNGSGSPTPYPNNQIPIVNPAAIYLFQHPKLYPLPNTTPTSGLIFDNYTGRTKQFTRNDQGMIRVDWKPTDKDTVTARWLQGKAADGTTESVIPISFPSSSYYPTKGIALNEVHVFSASMVNEFRAGFTRVRWLQGEPTDPTGTFGLKGNSILGINATQPFPGFAGINFSCNSMAGCNSSDIPSNLGNDAGGTQITDNTFQYSDNLTIFKGHHTIEAGVQILRYQQNNYYPGNYGANGYFNYYPAATMNVATNQAGYPLADFALDDASFIGQGGLNENGQVAGDNGQRQYRTGYFVQDDSQLSKLAGNELSG